MTAAIASSTAAIYVAPIADLAPSSDVDPVSDTSSSKNAASTSAAQLASSTQLLAPNTVTAVVAQQASNTTPSASASPAASADTSTPFSKNQAQFEQLISVINDTTGKYSQTDQMNALDSLTGIVASSGLIGIDKANEDAFNQAYGSSPIAQLRDQLASQANASIEAAWNSGSPTGRGAAAAAAELNFYSGLSEDNQQVYFNLTVNHRQLDGSKTYASANQWISTLYAAIAANPSATATTAQSHTSSPGASSINTASATSPKLPALATSTASSSSGIALQVLNEAANRTAQQAKSSPSTSTTAASLSGSPSKSHTV
jgi:hypothetical protein